MAVNHDWLPSNHAALHNQGKMTFSYLEIEGNRSRMGIEGANAAWYEGTFRPKWGAFDSAFAAWLNPATRTGLIATAFKSAKASFVAAYRPLYTGMLKNNPNVTDSDLEAMGLPARRGSGHAPAPAPSTYPEAQVKLPAPATVEISFRDSGAEHRAKPAGVHCAEIRWGLLDEVPQDWGLLANSGVNTRTPFRLQFAGTDRGKKLFYALRWENTRGKKGPWSEIGVAIVP